MVTCYMCSKQKTSVEHVPPLCLFPEKKEHSFQTNFRKNLITVPSCDDHNSNKSKDDEYLRFVLVSHFENNSAAQTHFTGKVIRSLKRRPHISETFMPDQLPAVLNGEQTMAFKVDLKRFNNGVSQICRGLYFEKYKEKWLDPIRVYSSCLLAQRSDKLTSAEEEFEIFRLAAEFFKDVIKEGENPEIFQYQMARFKDKMKSLHACYFMAVLRCFVFHPQN
ncbi:MAG: hypothetical protein R2864_03160 [Syntrophotaleaceae bacterium]